MSRFSGSISSLTAMIILPTAEERRKSRGAIEGAPDFRFQGVGTQLNHDQLAQVGEWFVHENAGDAADIEMMTQMMQERRFVGDPLDQAAFAGRDLADDRDQHRIAAAGDRRYVHEG